MKRQGLFFLITVLLSLLLSCTFAYAQSPLITNGLNYITTTQNPDGSWGSEISNAEILPSTVSVIETLQVLNQTSTSNYSNALLWLQSQGLETTDYLSERIHALSVAGTDEDLLVSYLDGIYTDAWGGYDDYETNNLDTVLALSALKKINYQDQNIISSALYYLTSNQNPDGGWGFYQVDESNVYMTAMVLNTLSQFKSTYNLQTPINKAVAYLLAKQNPDGGFAHSASSGQGSSTVYETALAFEALLASGAVGPGNASVIQNAINYLTVTQLPNGSWDDDPYSTALALRALANIEPNLTISSTDITFSNQTPTRGETVTVTAAIHNTGPATAENIFVRFFDGVPSAGGVQIGIDQIIQAIDPYSSATVNVAFSTSGIIGRRAIFVQIDPANAISEASEIDNIASSFVTINTLPDLYIDKKEITYFPVNPTPDVPLNMTFFVRNLGEKALENVLTKVYNAPPEAGGTALASFTIQSLPGRSLSGVMATIYSPTPGVNTYYFVADPDNTIQESNESNNVESITILVGMSKDEDLAIFPHNVSFFVPPGAKPGDSITINAVVNNAGSANVTTDVVFYDGDPANGGTVIGSKTIIVSAMGTQIAQINWVLPADNRTICVVVDSSNAIPETNETNNYACKEMFQTIPDLVVYNAGITSVPSHPTPRSKVTITSLVNNYGAEGAYAYLTLYDGAPENGGIKKGVFQFASGGGGFIKGGSYNIGTATIDNLSLGEHELYVIADPNNLIQEMNESNNRGMIKITITDDPRTDLSITSEDITFSPMLPMTGQQVDISASIYNFGSERVYSCYVSFYNGKPSAGGQLISRVSAWFDQESSKKINVSFTMPSGVPEIYVVVDDDNRIPEMEENNNTASRTIDTYRNDLSVVTKDISLNPVMPDEGNDVSFEVAVQSRGLMERTATLKLYEGKPESGILLGSRDFTATGNRTIPLSFPGYPYPGSAILTAVIENISPAEEDLTNNQATAIFGEHIEDGASNEGTDFWIAWPPTYYLSSTIIIQSKYATNLTVSIPVSGGAYKKLSAFVSPGFPAVIPLYDGYPHLSPLESGINDKAIHITADKDVSVIFHVPVTSEVADDSYTALPTNMLGTEYYFLSYVPLAQRNPINQYMFPANYTIIAVEDNTNVDAEGSIINLNRGQTYHFNSIDDLSGTHVKSDKQIVFIAGTTCSFIPSPPFNYLACDSIYEQLPPVTLLGTAHYTAPLYSPNSSDVFRILAVEDGSEIAVKDKYYTKPYSLNKGQWTEYESELSTLITSNKPIMVAQFAKGKQEAGVGDPFQMTIIPNDKLKTEYRYYTHPGYEEGDYITIIAPQEATTVMLDGGILDIGWSPLPDGGSYLLTPSTEGEHVITADKPVAVYAHGYRDYGSYGYPAGIALPASNLIVSNLAANPPRPSDGQLVEITATLSNEGNKWAKDIIVRAYNGDPAEGGIQIGADVYFDILYPKETKTVAFTWDTHGYAGINNIYIVADPLNTIKESNELDNIAMTIMEVLAPVKPDPTVTVSDVTLSQTLVNEGDAVTLTVKIRNRGMDVGDIPVGLYLGDPTSGGALLKSATIRQIISLNGEATLTFTLNTLGFPEMSDLFVLVDPQNVIDELIETNNKASKLLRVNRKKLSLDVITDGTRYQARSSVGIDVYIKNQSISPWSGTGDIYVEDTASQMIAHVASFTVDDLKPIGVENWSYGAPITVTKTTEMRDAIAIAYVNFNSLFSSLVLTGKTIDLNSIRVLEFDSSGSVVGEKKAKFEKGNGFDAVTNPSGRLQWLMDGVTPANTARYFQLYFDTLGNGTKLPSLNTVLPEKGRLIAFTGYWGDLYTATSNSDGTFGNKVQVDTIQLSLLNGIMLNDFNNDGFPDIIAGNVYGDIFYYQNRADASDTYLAKVKIGNVQPSSTSNNILRPITSGDYNNDGNQDFILNMQNAPDLHIFLGHGDGTFTHSVIPVAGIAIKGKASGDVNRDGNLDLVVGNNLGMVSVYYGTGDGSFGSPVEIRSIGKDIYGLAVGDMDNDGYVDILANGANDGIAYIIKGMAGGEFKPVEQDPSLKTSSRAGYDIVDINVDGKWDVVATDYNYPGKLLYFEGNGDATFKAPIYIGTSNYYAAAVSASRINPEVIATLGTAEKIEGRLYQFIWNTGTTLSGNYKVHVTLSEGQGVIADGYASFGIQADASISSNVVVDKMSYKANETATMISTITSLSRNAIMENLAANITIKNAQATVLYTETNTIALLTPDQSIELKTYWNTSTNPPGIYPVTLEVKDASGAVLSTSTANLTISSDIEPSVLLRGQISVDKQSLLQGTPLNISYSVTNVGNIDLSQIDISIPVVHVVELTAYDTLTDQTSLNMGQTFSNTQQLNTNAYSAKDYLVVLRAKISGVEETLSGTYFRVEGAPSAPSLYLPSYGSDIETYTPILTVNNASDPNDDDLTYEFELYADSGLTTLITSSAMIYEGEGITSWQAPLNLEENAVYYWRARAYDGRLYGDWMTPATFRVNLTNEPPTAPTLSSPSNNSEVDTVTPLLVVNNASDPDSTKLTYNFVVANDPDFLYIVTSVLGVFEGEGTTSWLVPEGILSDNTHYYWRAQADDWLDVGPWIETAGFFVNTGNDAPDAPVIISPANKSEIVTPYTDIIASNTTDLDHDALTYFFEIDTVNTFDSPEKIMSGNIPEGIGTTAWFIDGLVENTDYYARAKANDGLAESDWSDVIQFFVNTVNEAPSIPTLSNPSNGAGVNVFTPTLSVHNAVDPDRDILTYEFELYGDAGMTNLVSSAAGVEEGDLITGWTAPVTLIENRTYYWRARAYDGQLHSGWTPLASFTVNTANDAPTGPTLHAPAEGSSTDTLYPTLSIHNAEDPDSDSLTYDFEIYSNGVLTESITGIPQNISGITSVTLLKALNDNTTYTWRARAYDGDRYGAWMDMAEFSIHISVNNITATIDFDPNTLNQKDKGKWVTVYIELPKGYSVNDIIVSSLLLEGTVPVEPWPYAIEDYDKDGIPDLKVKFRRDAVINILPNGDNVLVHVSGTVGTTAFDGVDVIRVIY